MRFSASGYVPGEHLSPLRQPWSTPPGEGVSLCPDTMIDAGAAAPGQTVKPRCLRMNFLIMNRVWVIVMRYRIGHPRDKIADWTPTDCWPQAKMRMPNVVAATMAGKM